MDRNMLMLILEYLHSLYKGCIIFCKNERNERIEIFIIGDKLYIQVIEQNESIVEIKRVDNLSDLLMRKNNIKQILPLTDKRPPLNHKWINDQWVKQ